jgi:CheY-like chemotaxis protein
MTARILAVDDDEVIRDIISSMLRAAGYQCEAVESGLDALAMLAAGEEFDLILTDMMNWPLDGLSLLLRIKEKFPDLPVVVASAIHDDSVTEACIRGGAFEYLREPFERTQLLATVSRALERGKEAARDVRRGS